MRYLYIEIYIDGDYSTIWLKDNITDNIIAAKDEILTFIRKEQPLRLHLDLKNISDINNKIIQLIIEVKKFARIFDTKLTLHNTSDTIKAALHNTEIGYLIAD